MRMRTGERGFTLVEIVVAVAIMGFGLTIFLSAMVVGLKGVGDTTANSTGPFAMQTLYARLEQAYNTDNGSGGLLDPGTSGNANYIEVYSPSSKSVDEAVEEMHWRSTTADYGTTHFTIINKYPIGMRFEVGTGPYNVSVTGPDRQVYLVTAVLYTPLYRNKIFTDSDALTDKEASKGTLMVNRMVLYGFR